MVLAVSELRDGTGVVMLRLRKSRQSLAKTEDGTRRAAAMTRAFT